MPDELVLYHLPTGEDGCSCSGILMMTCVYMSVV